MGNKDGRVYGEFTVKFWADPDLFAKEYGVGAGKALQCARDDFEGQATVVPDGFDWRGAEIVPTTPARAPFVLSDYDRRIFMKKYDDWRALGTVLAHRAEHGDTPAPDDMEAQDDTATELYGELASMLFGVDDCGHQEVTVAERYAGRYVVQCDNCPVSWTVVAGIAFEGVNGVATRHEIQPVLASLDGVAFHKCWLCDRKVTRTGEGHTWVYVDDEN